MICRKSWIDSAVALFVLTGILISSGSTFLGVFRYVFDLRDDQYLHRDVLIMTGNVLSLVFALGALYVLFNNSADMGMVKPVIAAIIFFNVIAILYLTFYDTSDTTQMWIGLVFVILDIYVKVTAVLLGYGVCTIADVPSALTNIVTKTLGGKSR